MNNIEVYDKEVIEDKVYKLFYGSSSLSTFGILKDSIDVKFTRGFIIKLAEEYKIGLEFDRDNILHLKGEYNDRCLIEEYIKDIVYEKLRNKEYVSTNEIVVLKSSDISKEGFEMRKIRKELISLKNEYEIEKREKEMLLQQIEKMRNQIKTIEEEKNKAIEKAKEIEQEKNKTIEKIKKFLEK
jgi:hypothetical protein